MKRRQTPISDVLEQAIRDSRLSLRELSRQAGIHSPSLVRFLKGERGLNLDTADRVAKLLGLRLVQDKDKAKKRGR
jgi:plasmid maintenance system antidote protein VapI